MSKFQHKYKKNIHQLFLVIISRSEIFEQLDISFYYLSRHPIFFPVYYHII